MNILIKFNLFVFWFSPLLLFSQGLKRYEFKYQKMGTQFNIIAYTNDSTKLQLAVNQSFNRIDELNQIFSDYEAASELSLLSNTAGSNQKIKVSSELWQVLKLSKTFSKKSKGAYDISIGPLSKLWRSMFRKQEIFNGVKINNAKLRIGYKKIKFYPFSKKIKLTDKGMRLDAGGIAKGFTVDEIVKTLQKHGFYKILVDGGGDLYLGNPPPNKEGWRIQINQKNNNGALINKELILKNIAIAASGDTYRFLEWNGQRFSHIIDPRTGYGVVDQKIINVLATNCTVADATASTLSVLSEKEGNLFLKKIRRRLDKKIELIE